MFYEQGKLLLSCLERQTFLQKTRTGQGLEEQRQNTINDIRSTIYPKAVVAPPTMGCMLRIASAGPSSSLFLSAQTRIIEFPEIDILSNYHYPYSGTLRGVHDWERGKILLCEGKWCRETLIHEILHSVSFPCVRSDLRRRLINFFEGLTEFFAGYVMFRCYHNVIKRGKRMFMTYVL